MYTPLTSEFLLKRGYCCNNGCKNCPYNYKKEIMKEDRTRPQPNQEQIIALNNTNKWQSGRSESDPVTLWNKLKNDYDDGVCEGEYIHPTKVESMESIEHNRKHQDKVLESNRKRNQPKIQDDSMVLVEKDLLEKLKDFNYWKEWKNK